MEQLQGHQIKIIVLRRYLPAVLKSFITMGYFSNRNRVWPAWMHLPGSCDSAFIPPAQGRLPDQYDLAIGYLIDIEARVQRFKDRYPDCDIHETTLEALQEPDEVSSLFNWLEVVQHPATRDRLGKVTNDRASRKSEIGIDTTLDICTGRIHAYLEACRLAGVCVPPLPQMT
jgi:hypothetical protein